jgi:acyl carrier protein
MTNKEKYENAFIEAFEINKEDLSGLEYNSISQWDSVGHMGLMAALEDAFDVMMEMDEIIDFSSFDKGKEILSKHNVQVD